ncbi:MAG: hypothetical protein SGJ20_04810 [Planctomycetota bacterium]|nr:hypothetical protein [Planctomycetota bacterium]
MDEKTAVLSLSETLSKVAQCKSDLRALLENHRDLYERENDFPPADAISEHLAMLDSSDTIEDYLQKARLASTGGGSYSIGGPQPRETVVYGVR